MDKEDILNFIPREIEKKWRDYWEKQGINKTDLKAAKKPFYNLMMYPYPSAEGLHVGNVYAFTGADIYGRFKRMQGYDVFEPMGFDSGGIHSENYAIKVGVHPKIQIPKNVKHFKDQLHQIGAMYDWDHTVDAMDPDYYRWTQWIFVQLFKAGLAYKKKAKVTWCPSCKTTLSDEQTEKKYQISNIKYQNQKSNIKNKNEIEILVCERCKTPIEKKYLDQWFFRITKYADRLLQNTYKLDWTEKVLLAQRNWIGKSEGAEIIFNIVGAQHVAPAKTTKISVFTTRPDTLYGCTFMLVSPEYVQKLNIKDQKAKIKVNEYVEKAKTKSDMERKAVDKDKTGVFTGLYAINPVNKEKLPIWVADYVLDEYGEGAVMGVPGHDERDFQFAKKYELPIKTVIKPVLRHPDPPVGGEGSQLDSSPATRVQNDEDKKSYEGEGVLVNSGPWDGWKYPQDLDKVIQSLEKLGIGSKKIQYKLRDWCISRQRYWGPPIPMINCSKHGWVPVPEKDLPVLLPDTDDYLPGEAGGKPPLARVPEFVKTKCPECGGEAQRETDVSDTFLDSSWYFLRYPSTDINNEPFDKQLTKKWLPVDQYTGGAEHSVLHLLYSRFITMALHDLGYLDFEEPFPKFYAHGLMIKDGAKMSKSKGNIVNPDEYIAKFGADSLRAYLMFMGPYDQGGDFRDTGMIGMFKFVRRLYMLAIKSLVKKTMDKNLQKALHKTIKKVGEDYGQFKYNTAIAALMTFVNVWQENIDNANSEIVRTVALLIAPLMPHLAEELWGMTKTHDGSVHLEAWPKFDPSLIKEEMMTIVIQVNGKVRDKITVGAQRVAPAKDIKEKVISMAKQSDKIKRFISGKTIIKTVYIPGRLINFVI